MERREQFVIGEYYHLYNRGVDKRFIFQELSDYERFLKTLYLSNSDQPFTFREIYNEIYRGFPSVRGEPSGGPSGGSRDIYSHKRGNKLVEIGAFCLMPNHFHLLVKEAKDGGISEFMGKLSTSYTSYFNLKNKRTGCLFQSVFKSKHIKENEYLRYLLAYIHLNPVKLIESEWKEKGIKDLAKAKDFLYSYKYSSLLDYLDQVRPEKKILSLEEFPDFFSNKREFEDFMEDWLRCEEYDESFDEEKNKLSV